MNKEQLMDYMTTSSTSEREREREAQGGSV